MKNRIKVLSCLLIAVWFGACSSGSNESATPVDDGIIDAPDDSETPDVPEPEAPAPDAPDPVEETPPPETPEEPAPTPVVAPSINRFSVDTSCVMPGFPVVISWETADATEVWINDEAVAASGAKEFLVNGSKNYTLKVKNGELFEESSISVSTKNYSYQHQLTSYTFEEGSIDAVYESTKKKVLILSGGKLFKGNQIKGFKGLHPNDKVDFTAGALSPHTPKIIYAGTTGRLYRSSDNGETWPDVIPIRRNGYDLVITSLHVLPSNPHKVVVGVDGGAFVYDDEARKLELLTSLNTEIVDEVVSDDDKIIYKTVGGLFESDAEFGKLKSISSTLWNEAYKVRLNESGDVMVGSNKGLFKRGSDGKWARVGDYAGKVYDFRDAYPAMVNDLNSGESLVSQKLSFSLGNLSSPGILALNKDQPSEHYYLANGKELLEYNDGKVMSTTPLEVKHLVENDTLVGIGENDLHEIHKAKVYADTCE